MKNFGVLRMVWSSKNLIGQANSVSMNVLKGLCNFREHCACRIDYFLPELCIVFSVH